MGLLVLAKTVNEPVQIYNEGTFTIHVTISHVTISHVIFLNLYQE